MNKTNTGSGLALLCSLKGKILNTIRDDFGLLANRPEDISFTDVVDAESKTKAGLFLQKVQDEYAAFDWEMNIASDGHLTSLHFAGTLFNNNVLVIAAKTREDVMYYYTELMKINNEQANQIRNFFRDQSRKRSSADKHSELWDELSQLNNELANMQRELNRKNYQLNQLNAQKDQFLGMAAHDLRNPLGVIRTYSRFLIDEASANLNPEQNTFLSIIHDSSEFMLDMVDDLLDISRIESGKLELNLQEENLADRVQNAVKLNNALAGQKNIHIRFSNQSSSPFVRIDGPKIDQVLNNLISNAVKYSFPETEVEVRLTDEDKQTLRVSIEDHGQGIPESDLGNLFQPYKVANVKTTGGEKSTGLGLVIVKKIVEGHGGTIEVQSTPGKGSTFSFCLKKTTSGVSADPPKQPSKTAPFGKEDKARPTGLKTVTNLTILLADDNVINQKLAARILEKAGHNVTVVSDGAEAVDRFKEAAFDLVLMDLQMPGMNGIEAAKEIRQSEVSGGPRTPIVALTGYDDQKIRQDMAKIGIDAVLIKPFQKETFDAVINDLKIRSGAQSNE